MDVKASSLLSGGFTPTSIVNRCSDGSTLTNLNSSATVSSVQRKVTTAITANTLTPVITLNQPGVLDFLSVWATDTTPRTMRARLTINGVVVFDNPVTSVINAVGTGLLLVGFMNGTGASFTFSPQVKTFKTLLFEVCSSLTETGKLTYDASYHI